MKRSPLQQRTDWNCGLCPQDNFPTFATPREMREHARDTHGLPFEQTERMKKRAVMFLDGAHGSAQQVYNWFLEDDRIFATQVWSSGVFCKSRDSHD